MCRVTWFICKGLKLPTFCNPRPLFISSLIQLNGATMKINCVIHQSSLRSCVNAKNSTAHARYRVKSSLVTELLCPKNPIWRHQLCWISFWKLIKTHGRHWTIICRAMTTFSANISIYNRNWLTWTLLTFWNVFYDPYITFGYSSSIIRSNLVQKFWSTPKFCCSKLGMVLGLLER